MTIPVLNSCVSYTAGGGGAAAPLSIQRITTDTAFSGTTRDIAISSVVQANTAIKIGWGRHGNYTVERDACIVELTSSTNIRLTRRATLSSGTVTPYFITVLEYDPASIASIQRVSNSFVGTINDVTASQPLTISSVNTAKTVVYTNGFNSDTTGGIGANSQVISSSAVLTSSTNVDMYFCEFNTANQSYAASVIEFA